LRRDLPNSFRFCGSKGHALAVKKLLQTRYIPEITKIEHNDGRSIDPPEPVPWYPDSLAWWMTTPKTVVRKFPPFAAFQKFLVSETSIGNISRQEVVSMIPPLLMDLRPGMTVLDMCAAPGSKSGQLVELIHQGEEARVKKVLRAFAKDDGLDLGEETEEETNADLEADPSDAGRATGLLIANDSDYKRCHMLTHQLKRLSSPNVIITNHDATMFPSIKLPSEGKNPSYLKFDRILADVPCSGDGTLRKNTSLWKEWQPASALGLHLTQTRILVRALQMLKVGGRVVYSTCSMNPVENEAIVATAIERCGGPKKVDIIDCSDRLPGLKRVPGMKKWKIMDKPGRIWSSWEEVEEFTKTEGEGVYPGRVSETMFPRSNGSECSDLPLERCMRVYSHLQDTGGFFITVLEKKADIKAKPENGPKNPVATGNADAGKTQELPDIDSEEPASLSNGTNGTKRSREDGDEPTDTPIFKKSKVEEAPDGAVPMTEVDPSPPAIKTEEKSLNAAAATRDSDMKERKHGQPVEEPFKYLPEGHAVMKNIKEFYSLSPRFPQDRWMIRNATGEPAKGIYYTTSLARDILVENEGRGVKFLHAGVRMFMRQDAPSAEVCRWRIQNEGMPIIQGYVGEQRIVRLRSKETLRKLLIEMFPKIANGEWARLDEIGERVRDIGMGCCVLRIEPDGTDAEFTERMALPLWKSIHSLNLMLPKEDRSAMLLRIFNDTTPLVNKSLQKDKDKFAMKKEEAEPDREEKYDDVDVEDMPTPESVDADMTETTVEMAKGEEDDVKSEGDFKAKAEAEGVEPDVKEEAVGEAALKVQGGPSDT
jgi:multisite-specific tRNA:(cytosine-C5)-methyltransferase